MQPQIQYGAQPGQLTLAQTNREVMSELNQAKLGRVAEWLNAPVLAPAELALAKTNLQVTSELKPAEIRKGGRAVKCTGLENRQRRKPLVGSNPTPSARSFLGVRLAPRRAVALNTAEGRLASA